MLVGNKIDKEEDRVVTTERGQAFAQEHGLLFEETSAHSAIHVREAFENLLQTIFDSKAKFISEENEKLRQINKAPGCC